MANTHGAKPTGGSDRGASQPYAEASAAASALFEDVEDKVRTFIEEKPFVAAFAVLAAGWLIGRMHRIF